MTLDAVRVIGELRRERDRLARVIGILDGDEQDLIDQALQFNRETACSYSSSAR